MPEDQDQDQEVWEGTEEDFQASSPRTLSVVSVGGHNFQVVPQDFVRVISATIIQKKKGQEIKQVIEVRWNVFNRKFIFHCRNYVSAIELQSCNNVAMADDRTAELLNQLGGCQELVRTTQEEFVWEPRITGTIEVAVIHANEATFTPLKPGGLYTRADLEVCRSIDGPWPSMWAASKDYVRYCPANERFLMAPCSLGGTYKPHEHVMRYCSDCMEWFHEACLGEKIYPKNIDCEKDVDKLLLIHPGYCNDVPWTTNREDWEWSLRGPIERRPRFDHDWNGEPVSLEVTLQAVRNEMKDHTPATALPKWWAFIKHNVESYEEDLKFINLLMQEVDKERRNVLYKVFYRCRICLNWI